MLPKMMRSTAAIAALTGVLACFAQPAAAQVPAPPRPQAAPQPPTPANRMVQLAVDDPNADRTRDQFMQLLEKYPPSVGRVMKLDPSLLGSSDYLATYPSLATFLAQHPDVQRNPGYYLERVHINTDYVETRSEAFRIWDDILGWMGGLSVATLIAVSLGWLIRLLVDYRRWYRLSKVQAEAHTKLLDRMTANEELLAYVQSPAGSRFLESAPIALDPGTRRIGAPFSRILWSAQAGVVLVAGGLGLRLMGRQLPAQAADVLPALGTLVVTIGVGLLLSCGVSYLLSLRLGLLEKSSGAQS
jgi:hypothetical protein